MERTGLLLCGFPIRVCSSGDRRRDKGIWWPVGTYPGWQVALCRVLSSGQRSPPAVPSSAPQCLVIHWCFWGQRRRLEGTFLNSPVNRNSYRTMAATATSPRFAHVWLCRSPRPPRSLTPALSFSSECHEPASRQSAAAAAIRQREEVGAHLRPGKGGQEGFGLTAQTGFHHSVPGLRKGPRGGQVFEQIQTFISLTSCFVIGNDLPCNNNSLFCHGVLFFLFNVTITPVPVSSGR